MKKILFIICAAFVFAGCDEPIKPAEKKTLQGTLANGYPPCTSLPCYHTDPRMDQMFCLALYTATDVYFITNNCDSIDVSDDYVWTYTFMGQQFIEQEDEVIVSGEVAQYRGIHGDKFYRLNVETIEKVGK